MIGHDYPYLDTKDLNLDWLLKNMKKIIEDWATYQTEMNQNFANLDEAFNTLKAWVDNYFDNLDVQREINNKIDAMRASGELAAIMNPIISSETADWLSTHITNPSNPPIDTSLSVTGAAADAKVVGDRLAGLTTTLDDVEAVVNSALIPENLYDPYDEGNLYGSYYDSSNNLIYNAAFMQSGLVSVTPGDVYTSSETGFPVNFYDSNEDFLSSIPSWQYSADKKALAPENAAYARFIFSIGNRFTAFIHNLSDPNAWLIRKVTPGETTFFKYKNLFSQTSGTLYGKYYNTSGVLVTNAEFGQSDFIPVFPDHRYTSASTDFFILWYDSSENLIGNTGSGDYTRDGFATAPAGASFARFMFYSEDIDEFYVYDLTSDDYVIPKEYIEAGYGGEIDEYNTTQFNGKKWTAFGDSITFRNTWQPQIVNLLRLEYVNCGIGSTAISGNYVLGNTSLPSFWMPVRLNAVKSSDPDLVTILGGANDVVQSGLSIGSDAEFTYPAPADPMSSVDAPNYSTSSDYAVGAYCTKDGTRYQCNTAITGGEAWNGAHWTAVKNVNSFIGAYSYIIENLLSWKRTLSILILGTTWAHNDGVGYAHGITYTDLSDACKKVAQYYGLPFVDLHGLLGYNKFTMGSGDNAVYSDDQIHPNAEGSKQLTKVVLNAMVNEVTIH